VRRLTLKKEETALRQAQGPGFVGDSCFRRNDIESFWVSILKRGDGIYPVSTRV